MRRTLWILLAAAVLIGIALAAVAAAQPPNVTANVVSLQAVSTGAGYATVDRPREFMFPKDHGPHPEYQTEWWYYTGNLDAADGRHFGYQLTFFRRALTPSLGERESDWATNQMYFAHFAISDVKNNRHLYSERFSRGAAGLAGATGTPYHVWLEDWNATSLSGTATSLHAVDAGHALDLTLSADKPVALHGDRGMSPKSDIIGDASYYYSFTRMDTHGTLTIDGQTIAVQGSSWMDHEFGTTDLGPDAVGWDWFSFQLTDRRELMLFLIRKKDGSSAPASSGTLIEPDGSTRHLTRDEMQIQVVQTWKSNQSGSTYPARWNISVPSAGIELAAAPYMADQEMRLSILYWEGAVAVSGRSNGNAVQGNGFIELTGYK